MKPESKHSNNTAGEHILVCLSSAPSNERVVKTAVRMASVFGSQLTALYVRTPDFDSMDPADRKRLESNIRLAEKAGAEIVTTHGEDIPEQIAEYARLSGATKIVIGINSAPRKRLFFRATLTERLFELVPGIDVHVIPDTNTISSYRSRNRSFERSIIPSWRDIGVTAALLAAATGIGFLFQRLFFDCFFCRSFFFKSLFLKVFFSLFFGFFFSRSFFCSFFFWLSKFFFEFAFFKIFFYFRFFKGTFFFFE